VNKPESNALAAQGVEIVAANIDDKSSIKAAMQGASVVFGNTVFNDAFIRPTKEIEEQLKPGQSLREWCYETELRQGKNIADAVATLDTLELFVWSSLSNASKWSGGEYKGVYHFDSKAHVVDYIHRDHPALAKKMSLLQLGLFITNWKWGPASIPWQKVRSLIIVCTS
jgi:hypothetical protein